MEAVRFVNFRLELTTFVYFKSVLHTAKETCVSGSDNKIERLTRTVALLRCTANEAHLTAFNASNLAAR